MYRMFHVLTLSYEGALRKFSAVKRSHLVVGNTANRFLGSTIGTAQN